MYYTFITGATGVLGGEFARRCAALGHNLFLTGRSMAGLTALKQQLIDSGAEGDIAIFPCDLADESSRAALFDYAKNYIFSYLINVAGADIQKPFSAYDEGKLTFQLRANFEAAASCCLFCIGHRAPRLKVVNISSLCGEYAIPYFAAYSAAKGALTSLSLALAQEYRGQGITFTAVLTGAIYTRPDVKEYIAAQGLWGKIAAKTPQYVVTKSLKAAQRGKKKYIPGAANKLAYLASKLLPRALLVRIMARSRRNVQKDAF